MNILFFGEFSGFYSNLQQGLRELGHESVIASAGDSYKNTSRDIDFARRLSGLPGKLEARLRPLCNLPRMTGFDVVQVINPFAFAFRNTPFPRRSFFNCLRRNNAKLFVSAAGNDSYFWRYARERLRYSPLGDHLKYDLLEKTPFELSNRAVEFNEYVVSSSDGIIPIMYEYEAVYQEHAKRLPTIPLPMNTDKIEYRPNDPAGKLVVFHGLNRYGFKGTHHVEKAFERLQEKYPNDLELIIDGKLPLREYLALMRRTNVVIDQTSSYSCGMNALYALAMGKVVLGGAEPESLRSLGINETPVFNIKPSADDLVKTIEYLLQLRSQIPELGRQSRKFVEAVHGHRIIAQKYIDVWRSRRV